MKITECRVYMSEILLLADIRLHKEGRVISMTLYLTGILPVAVKYVRVY